jgi:hypothetical protein
MEVITVVRCGLCVVSYREQTTDNRQQTTDNRQQTTDNRQPKTDNRQPNLLPPKKQHRT